MQLQIFLLTTHCLEVRKYLWLIYYKFSGSASDDYDDFDDIDSESSSAAVVEDVEGTDISVVL